ncbi:enterochelin esterase [Candidatus Pantoea symbiotica]|jgi:enterochelin esterase family protein|uniref:Enterochelin esterase n=1 Tax=Candidatus Pantoea symbiotica TaxID=1884370 RepID=A0A1I3XFN6_9GAMM|nr:MULTISPECIES: enterochelin esterase [Pantoea]KAJ9434404.1 enterochelin esterase [Pantoea sp. YR343]SFK18300.1 enterochelin esterase [Pantoea symbiotica]SFU79401.1 enterochelin esterase [Pantoea sp. YR525]
MTWRNDVTGSEAWWQAQQSQGIPRIELADDGQCQVTFFWRDPQGDETQSSTQRVWINITGVTDHHQRRPPQSLMRVAGTNVWYWQTSLPANWRGSYCLMPDEQATDFTGVAEMSTLRNWWRDKFPTAQADPLNHLRGWSGGRGMGVSPLHLPHAPNQQLWQAVDHGTAPAIELQQQQWDSALLGNSRKVWIHTTGEANPEQRPLAIMLDGQFWAHSMPIAGPLQQLTDAGSLPPAVYLFIDIIDSEHRSRELPCNAQFWQAIQQELLPQIAQSTPYRQQADSTIVAGQSFGGLASVFAALHWPETFGNALSLSGSFWWPERGNPHGWLLQALDSGLAPRQPLRFWLEAGKREGLILQANQQLQQQLSAAGYQVNYQPVEGGHDALCWRGSLLNGLQALWSKPEHPCPNL